MRYLYTFKIFEGFISNSLNVTSETISQYLKRNVIKDIEDICLEIIDQGFTVDVDSAKIRRSLNFSKKLQFALSISNVEKAEHTTKQIPFKLNQIEDLVLRLMDYMNGLGFDSSVFAETMFTYGYGEDVTKFFLNTELEAQDFKYVYEIKIRFSER